MSGLLDFNGPRTSSWSSGHARIAAYAVLADDEAEKDGDLRVLDESGEDYLYAADLFAADRFVAIDVPAAVRASLLKQA